MTTLIHERVSLAQRGQNQTVIGRMASGWAVLGDAQFPRGYCLLLPDPVVGSINALEGAARAQFLSDMVAIGDALLALTGAYRIKALAGEASEACRLDADPDICTLRRSRHLYFALTSMRPAGRARATLAS